MTQIIAVGIILAATAAGIYFFAIKGKQSPSNEVAAPGPDWTFQYSSNMKAGQTPADFDYPDKNGVHYCVRNASSMKPGQTITIKFTQTGIGKVVATEYPEHGALVRAYIQRKDDDLSGKGDKEFYRLWCGSAAVRNDNAGSFTITAALNTTNWTGVYGKSAPDALFADVLANAMAVGWTHGGDMAGHGQYVEGGDMHFHLDGFLVA